MATIKSRLDKLTNAQLVVLYNGVSERHVSKFSDHATAVARTAAALEKGGRDFTVDGDEVKLVDPGTPVSNGHQLKIDGKRITVLAEANPKTFKSKSHARFALYKNGMLASDYIELVKKHGRERRVAVRDIAWDVAHGYIRLD